MRAARIVVALVATLLYHMSLPLILPYLLLAVWVEVPKKGLRAVGLLPQLYGVWLWATITRSLSVYDHAVRG